MTDVVAHKKNIVKLCRCHERCRTYAEKKFTDEFERHYGVNIQEDRDEIHPPTVYHRCASNLYRLRESASSHSLSKAPFTIA